jgi:MSHA biogenesis protein MshJ
VKAVNALVRAERWLAQISLRERALVLVALSGVALASWDAFVLRPHGARAGERRDERGRLSSLLASLDERRKLMETALGADPNAAQRARAAELQTRLEGVDGEIRASASGLISPTEMTSVLESLLSARPALRVRKLEGAPAVALVEPAPQAGAEAGPAAQPIYRHELRLEIEADFAETVEFLRAVEALPWKFFWDELRYEVGTYPDARVTLVVHTFSDREGWVGA